MRISKKLPLFLGPVLVLASFAFSTTPASAETPSEPWWHLSSLDRPTNIIPGSAKSEVQELKFAAGAEFELTLNHMTELVAFGTMPSAVELQAALEGKGIFGAAAYGPDNVEVTESPTATGTTFTITSIGADADKVVPALEVPFASPTGSVEAKVLTEASEADGEIVVTADNVGNAIVNGEKNPVQLSDVLPHGLLATSVSASVFEGKSQLHNDTGLECSVEGSGSGASCTLKGTYHNEHGTELPMVVAPFNPITMHIGVRDVGAESGAENRVAISGGGAPPASGRGRIAIGEGPPPFGVEGYEVAAEEFGGAADTQAGSHPFQFTTVFALNTTAATSTVAKLPALAKDLHFQLPPGLVGDPSAFEKCTLAQFFSESCPAKSVLGVSEVYIGLRGFAPLDVIVPLYNMEPSPGEAARFAFRAEGVPVYLDATVRSGTDYGVTVTVENITQFATFVSSEVTFWGVPGSPAHDISRGEGCLKEARAQTAEEHSTIVTLEHYAPCGPLGQNDPPAFLSLPSSCPLNPTTHLPEPLKTTLAADSWQDPAPLPPFSSEIPALDGCNKLPFSPSVKVSPDVQEASKPSGLTVDVHVPQEETLNAEGLAEGDPKDITVVLPEGLQLNPAAADGLQACSQGEVGFTHFAKLNPVSEPEAETAQFEPEVYDPATEKDEVTLCPSASKIATATIRTPLLPNPLEGAVYLAAPQNFSVLSGSPPENPFQSLVAMYLVVKDPVSGVIVKLAGSVSLSATGQITASFDQSPQAPFEDAELHFFGGERAPLATPALCRRQGEPGYTTLAAFTPWSSAVPVDNTSEFEITSGPGGTSCPNPPGDQSPNTLPFEPALASETTNINAGGFTPLSTTLSRPSGDQPIQSVTLHYPGGLSGLLSGVTLCPEAQANAGTCTSASEIGETIVSVGLGGDPFTVTGGKVYITEKYDGAPFGLSIVNPAKAGPFDLQQGVPVVVRAKIEVNPSTAALTITTNTLAEGHAIPSIIEGFPLQIQHVNVLINRNNFTFNPTNCNPAEITGAIDSAEGVGSPVKVPFQVTNCASLKFAPKFAVSTSGKTSRAAGASLHVKLTYPTAPQDTQANIQRVKVDLPKQLPSRLTTLQKACTAAQFAANPAGCPAASIIGHAKAVTPLIPVPLEGPAYFVSHGGEAFPSLIIVLQGASPYPVTLDLVGTTFISKAGITSSTFKTVPDAPVGSFELTLPEGKYSALAANGNLCTSKLAMPTEFLAQNGAKINESTPISVTGCKKVKSLTRAQKLTAALAVCRKKDKNKGKRAKCEAAAKKKYGALKKAKKRGGK